jgi:hypothetical protein
VNLRIRSLKSSGPGRCVAELLLGDETLVGTFQVDSRDGIATASSEPDVFRKFDGTADEQRDVVHLIVEFCRLAGQPGAPDEVSGR